MENIKYKCAVCGNEGTELELNRLGINSHYDGCCGVGSLVEIKNNKYYTPSIEEFCVGFEYETNLPLKFGNSLLPDNVWHKFTVEVDDFLGELVADVGWNLEHEDIPNIRVKFLDKEDIESLGWKYVNFIPNGDGDYRWYDEYELNSSILIISDQITIIRTISVAESDLAFYNSENNVFKGYIKNKSELKKLMSQLKIKHD